MNERERHAAMLRSLADRVERGDAVVSRVHYGLPRGAETTVQVRGIPERVGGVPR